MVFKLSQIVSPLLALCAVSFAGCKPEVLLDVEETSPGGGAAGGGPGDVVVGPPSFTPDKVDVLFVVDNSATMADKQQVLALALADLVNGMTNPPCVDAGGRPVAEQPARGIDVCPAGSSRARTPVQDMHLGVISSSLGSHGAASCDPRDSPANDDMAHLLARSDPQQGAGDLPTYEGKGFLVWDPAGRHSPAGDSDPAALASKLGALVRGVGQTGCGFEAPLESFYRFLVEPEPYEEIVLDHDLHAVPRGIDATLLQQRKDFLRPDSLLLVVMLTDENDCSIEDGGTNYHVAETKASFRMWRPRRECASDPNHTCCRSCAQGDDGCPPDPTCTAPDGTKARLTPEEDPVNLRCWDQKRRFGVDFLHPIARYTGALTSPTVTTPGGEVVPNPLFSDLDPADENTRIREPAHIVFTGIVGVPWQDLARDPGDLKAGLKTAAQLSRPLPGGDTTWDVVLGDPAGLVPPRDPFMIESMTPRVGANPITGDPIVPPGETGWNDINGREYTIAAASTGDLQYACVFDLLEERSCDETLASCDCRGLVSDSNDSPVCKPIGGVDPAAPGPRSTTQHKGKAYPGLRGLQLLQSLGDRGVTASVCPAQMSDPSLDDFGYRPVVRAVLDRLASSL